MSDEIVRGVELDPETRCAHWHSPLDVIAIRACCCGAYYACAACHGALADHPLVPWPRDRRDTRAVLCGVCRAELGIDEYLACGHTCPRCGAAFNPRCSLHHHLYFAP
jgi:uncharacterized CHY-type Zn-finger protein